MSTELDELRAEIVLLKDDLFATKKKLAEVAIANMETLATLERLSEANKFRLPARHSGETVMAEAEFEDIFLELYTTMAGFLPPDTPI